MANQDTSAALLGSGSVEVIELSQKTYSAHFIGDGDMSANPVEDVTSPPLNFSGSLSGSVVSKNYINTYVSFYGFLNASIGVGILCTDLLIDMTIQEIISTKCGEKGSSVPITRFRGDTYPVTARLSRNGNYDITGDTVRMSTQINNGTIYTVVGTITSPTSGIVEFELPADAINTAGVGIYDIEGNDGTYIYTYEKGVFTILDDVTV